MFLKGLHSSSFLELRKNKRCYFIQLRNFISNACIFKCTALNFSISLMSLPGQIRQQWLNISSISLSTSVSTFDLYGISRTRNKGWNLKLACTSAIQFLSLGFCHWSVLQNPQWHVLNQQPNCLTYLLFDFRTNVPKQRMLDFTHISC